MAHLGLFKILGDDYSQERVSNTKAFYNEANMKIFELEEVRKFKGNTQHESKVIQGEQARIEIKQRCATLTSTLGRDPKTLPDS